MNNTNKEDIENARQYGLLREEQYAVYTDFVRRHGFSMKVFWVLRALFNSPDGLTQKEICKKSFNSKQTVNLIVKKLTVEGHAILKESLEDKRNKIVVLTTKGKQYAEQSITRMNQAEVMAMSMLSVREQEQIIKLSAKMTQNLQKVMKGNN